MKIAIDLRSLSSGSVSGVENYTLNLLDHLLARDKKNTYTLFYNSFFKSKIQEFHFVNSKTKITRIPNKILNLALKFGLVSLEQLIGPFDVLFMPNLNQFSIRPQVKLVLTVHDLSPVVVPEFYDLKRRLWHNFLGYGQAFKRADLIFAVSEHTKSDLVKLFSIPEKKIKVIYPGIDHKIFNSEIPTEKLREVRNRYGLPGDFILFSNTIEPRKNLENLLKAFEQITHPSFLVIAGKKGWKYRSIFRAIKKSKKAAKIKYIGYIPEADKPALIRLSKLLVYPSFYEGFGFQPLEALFCKVPVMVSNVTSLPETVGQAGLLVNPYNISEMSFSIEQLLTDRNLREKILVKAEEKLPIYNWDLAAQKVLEAMESLWQK